PCQPASERSPSTTIGFFAREMAIETPWSGAAAKSGTAGEKRDSSSQVRKPSWRDTVCLDVPFSKKFGRKRLRGRSSCIHRYSRNVRFAPRESFALRQEGRNEEIGVSGSPARFAAGGSGGPPRSDHHDHDHVDVDDECSDDHGHRVEDDEDEDQDEEEGGQEAQEDDASQGHHDHGHSEADARQQVRTEDQKEKSRGFPRI